MVAILQGYKEVLKPLLKRSCKASWSTLLPAAVLTDRTDIVATFFELEDEECCKSSGADDEVVPGNSINSYTSRPGHPHTSDSYDLAEVFYKCLILAVAARNVAVTQMLLDHGANLNNPVVTITCMRYWVSRAVGKRFDGGIDYKVMGRTVLETAVRTGDEEIAMLLLRGGADPAPLFGYPSPEDERLWMLKPEAIDGDVFYWEEQALSVISRSTIK